MPSRICDTGVASNDFLVRGKNMYKPSRNIYFFLKNSPIKLMGKKIHAILRIEGEMDPSISTVSRWRIGTQIRALEKLVSHSHINNVNQME